MTSTPITGRGIEKASLVAKSVGQSERGETD